jgi:hypothetical protein
MGYDKISTKGRFPWKLLTNPLLFKGIERFAMSPSASLKIGVVELSLSIQDSDKSSTKQRLSKKI